MFSSYNLHYQRAEPNFFYACPDFNHECGTTFFGVELQRCSPPLPRIPSGDFAETQKRPQPAAARRGDRFISSQSNLSDCQQLTWAAKRNKSHNAYYSPTEAVALCSSRPVVIRVPHKRFAICFSPHKCYDWDVTCYDGTFPNCDSGQVKDS